MADISPAFANQGAMMRIMTEMAIQDTNAQGGINGRPLEGIYVDPKGDVNQATQLATQLVQQDKVDVLVGAVSSAECLAVEQLALKLTTPYMASTGCAADEFTSTQCNKYTFRPDPQGAQIADPFSVYLVKNFGPHWAVLYQDYAFGQSYQKTYTDSIARAGGQMVAKISMPLNEPNVIPYVSRIPTDGSIDGFLPPTGGSDGTRVMQAVQQFGFGKKFQVAGAGNRENFGGTWPDVLNGEVFIQANPTIAVPGDALSEAFAKRATAFASTPDQKQFADIMGGASKFGPGGQGYQAYTGIMAIKQAMIAANYTGKADTDKFIAALETINAGPSADFPNGKFIMNKADHQASTQMFIIKLNGQTETIVQTIKAEDLPPIGSCKIA